MIPFGVNVARASRHLQRRRRTSGGTSARQTEVASRTPPEAIVLSVQHSGSVRYYANRIDAAVRLAARGDRSMRRFAIWPRRAVAPYLVVDDWEEKEFRDRFSPGQPAGRLDWAPMARVSGKPGSAHLRVAGRRSCFRPMKKAALAFLVYCAITHRADISADPPVGLGAPERRGRSRAQYLDPLVEHADDAVLGCVVERARVLSGAGRA